MTAYTVKGKILGLVRIFIWTSLVIFSSCETTEETPQEVFKNVGKGVFILCEGNYNSGNSSLSYYNTETKEVYNGIFQRANDRKVGDTGQSINTMDGKAYIPVENSGIVWKIDIKTFKVEGQITTGETEHMINPRFIHFVNKQKAYITDLYSPYITVINPQTMRYTRSVSTGQASVNGYASTEEMVQVGDEVFVNCWSYSRNILIIDTRKDEVKDSITLSSWQPKSMAVDCNEKLWVITDGGYSTGEETFGNDKPHLYRIDPKSRETELDMTLDTDETTVKIAMSPNRDIIYILNNDVYKMGVTGQDFPSTPFLQAPLNEDGTRHMLYGIKVSPYNGEIYLADAVDYKQAGVIYRYDENGNPIDNFKVGIIPNDFAFTDATDDIPEGGDNKEDTNKSKLALVDTIFEYMPAPGHQVNGFTLVGDFIHEGATMEEACDSVMSHFKKQWMVSLGGQGGYVVAGFKESVANSHGDYDIAIKGNPYSYQNEPGIVWVSMDTNGDGLPNDEWYELAGSEYGTENETTGYAITYYKPTLPKSDIRWTDNMGGEDVIPYMENWNKHDSYWQDWVLTEEDEDGNEYRTYYGSRLKDAHTYKDGVSMFPPFKWGYADNDGDDYFRNNAIDYSNALGYFKISNAVNADGTPANLPYIDFVKVQTGQTGWTPNLGEASTEVYAIWKITR